MKGLIVIGICFFFLGCKQEKFQKIDAESIAEKEFKSLNLKEVDQFPLFENCDETAKLEDQKLCFEKQIHQWLKPHADSLDYDTEIADTLQLYLSIPAEGKLILDSIKTKLKVKKQLDSIFKKSPKLFPAQKRGIPVKVAFQLPLILKVN